jgi:acyl-CoA synthetase (AMP-forming)/AMP-acid ligase II
VEPLDRLTQLASDAPHRPFVIDVAPQGADGQRPAAVIQTYADAVRAGAQLDALLRRHGVEPGEPIGLRSAHPGRYATAFVGLLATGRTVVPLSPGAPDGELGRIARAAGVTTVVDDEPDAGPHSPLRVAAIDAGGVLLSRRRLPPGIVMFTSGTTGAPKGVVLDVGRLWHNACAVVAAHQFTADDVGLCPLPLWHINAEVVGLLAALRAGATLILDQGFHRSRFWTAAHEFGATWANAAPAIVHVLGIADDAASAPPSLRFVRSASAPLAAADRERFERRFGVPIIESYGMTEAAGMITVNSLHRARKPGSAGRPAGVDVRIVRDDGTVCGDREPGRVQIHGPSVIDGYLDGVDSYRFVGGGWLDTGDIGYFDADGDVFLLGRADDVINRGGEMVHPREVEEVLLRHPDVSAAAVVGTPDDKLGERVVALVVATPAAAAPHAALADELRDACGRELSAYKRPAEFRFVDELPIGATGKIRHGQARALAAASA